jgi:hypothetical protein
VTFAQTSFACGTHQDARVAYIAAFVLARYNIESSVATALNVGELDEEVWSTPLGTYRCIIVGKAAFDLLPERSQEWVFFPPVPAESDYWGAVGDNLPDTLARMANLLQRIREGTGSEFKRCWEAALNVQ